MNKNPANKVTPRDVGAARKLILVAQYLIDEHWRLGFESGVGKDCLSAAQHALKEASVYLGQPERDSLFRDSLPEVSPDDDIPF